MVTINSMLYSSGNHRSCILLMCYGLMVILNTIHHNDVQYTMYINGVIFICSDAGNVGQSADYSSKFV